MIKQVLRSPLIGASIFVLIIAFLLFSLMNTQVILAKLCFGILVTVTFLWLILTRIYNRNNPHDKIRLFGFIPSEFREIDEGQQWVTYKACRNVYIYYSIALPVTAGICFLFSQHNFVPLLCIGLLGAGQYIVYWLTTIFILNRI
ncbi:MAG TPA: hypothetical protein DEU03_06635 [Bacillus sp. (in: Bacteria)]|uniref:Uncharacterized protein n=1 Tax=Bacillus thuringiensis TaxID=1428 RepID=A0A9X5RLG6_BACTU|nr:MULTISPECIES: hypothetical protein [Bacillus cereus group]HCF52836.1 hypothetical protein [Bacillus sp. (in: firmicutes)]OFC87541.1 hypothetical protein BTGOE4_60370 [Bacillus thuringiensis]PFA62785.1 hypothetical protein CN403_30615 [Bacillus cereus]PFS43301.1 hypothetical protein COK44_26740 [Bacillus cereus]SME73760.1 hypothetical protein BACERE00198_05387 [Bacillus cereus]